MRATEDLVRDHEVSEANWQALGAEWSAAQLLDFLFTVGAYAMLGMVCNSLRIEREDALLELAETFGAP